MSLRIVSAVWDYGPDDQGELLVLLALADFADDSGVCWPSIRSVAQKARLTERGAQKIMRRLEARRYIEREESAGRGGTNRYRITPNAVHPAPERYSPLPRTVFTPTPEHGSPHPPNAVHRPPEPPFTPTLNSGSPEPSLNRKEEEEEGYERAREAPPPVDPPPLPNDPPPPRHPDDKLLAEVMAAVGLRGPSIPAYWMPPAATIHVGRWKTDLGLTDEEILAVARNSRARHPDPPSGPHALDRLMQVLAAEKAKPAMQLSATGEPTHDRPSAARPQPKSRSDARLEAWLSAARSAS